MQVPVESGTLHCEVMGKGQPMVLLHGGLGFDHHYLRATLEPLADAATLVFVDLRGNGASGRPSPDEWARIDDARWVADVDAVRAHLGFDRWTVFGHSYGSFLAQQYALAHGNRIDRLVLCNSAPVFDYQPTAMAIAQRKGGPKELAALTKAFTAPPAEDDELGRLWQDLMPIYFHTMRAEFARPFEGTRYSAGAFVRSMQTLGTFNVLDQLAAITMPTLVISGDDDWITPAQVGGERLSARIPSARYQLFTDCGHYPMIERKEPFLAVLRDWLSVTAGR